MSEPRRSELIVGVKLTRASEEDIVSKVCGGVKWRTLKKKEQRKMRIWGRYIDSIGVVEVLLEVGE